MVKAYSPYASEGIRDLSATVSRGDPKLCDSPSVQQKRGCKGLRQHSEAARSQIGKRGPYRLRQDEAERQGLVLSGDLTRKKAPV